MTITEGKIFTRFFHDADNSTNIIGNYAGSPKEFYIEPPGGEAYYINRMVFEIEDSAVNADDYGAITTVSVGVTLYVTRAGVTTTVMTPEPILKSAKWGEYCYNVDVKSWGAGNDFLVGLWDFSQYGVPIVLHGNKSDRLNLRFADNFTGLVEHEFTADGIAVTDVA